MILYIVGDVRSGTTLLDLILSHHPDVSSLGELHHLHEYWTDTYKREPICTCGEPVKGCKLYEQIESELRQQGTSLGSLHTKAPIASSKYEKVVKSIYLTFLPNFIIRFLWRRFGVLNSSFQVILNRKQIADATKKVTGSSVIVDSSKWVDTVLEYQVLFGDEVLALFNFRDGRATCLSKSMRDKANSLRYHMRSWKMQMVKMFLAILVTPNRRRHIIKYEDLCRDTCTSVSKILSKAHLILDWSHFNREMESYHNIGGSDRRFDFSMDRIEEDQRWREISDPDIKRQFGELAMINRLLGYQ